jgi:hypothetical protein
MEAGFSHTRNFGAMQNDGSARHNLRRTSKIRAA